MGHSNTKTSLAVVLAVISAALSQGGCATTYYLSQAFRGQMAIQNRAKPLTAVIEDERTEPEVKLLLKRVSEIKAFGETAGGLKPTKNYEHYVDLKRPAVVWSVSACEKLKFVPKEWAFPIVGSFTYLGWFSEEDARSHGKDLQADGWDVDVRPVTAYSTLGYFRDPIVSTMLGRGKAALGYLANVVMHESVHATVYVSNQSTFNESLASFVADKLTPVYLNAKASAADAQAYSDSDKNWLKTSERLRAVYKELDALYSNTALSDADKTSKKSEILKKLQKDLGTTREFNNASIIGYKTYDTGAEHFESAFKRCKNDMRRFVEEVGKITEKDFSGLQTSELAAPLAKACTS